MKVKSRVAGIIYDEVKKSIVLVKHVKQNRKYWIPPGGTIEPNEGLKESLKREIKEETNLDVNVKRLLYYNDFIIPNKKHHVELFFLCKKKDGRLKLGGDPEHEDENKVLKDVTEVKIEDINDLTVYPPELKNCLLKDFKNNFDVKVQYLQDIELEDKK